MDRDASAIGPSCMWERVMSTDIAEKPSAKPREVGPC
jgi:hypothetical protein